MHRSPVTIRLLGLLVAAILAATSTGCSIMDRLFLINADGPYAHGAGHRAGGCRDCETGACQDCETGCPDGRCEVGGCQDCDQGACHGPHVGRYGGLAKHHLTDAEKAMLNSSDYGAVQPAGPPTGAVAYPYYTTRGPRDFLAKCPPSIGP
jgi:hypothetical protein